jgi:glycosyltransferase involved in cell wall biosynthesis
MFDFAQQTVLIPARQPDVSLVPLIEHLMAAGFGAVIVLDDGSRGECQPIFAQLEKRAGVIVLRHAVNLGKGRALKSGFNFILNEMPQITGVITADADGQHTTVDIIRIARAMHVSPGQFILGTRVFAADVPLRSRFGNVLTRQVFSFMTGTQVTDTQTGLRGFPCAMLPKLMALPGERYEYEMTVLAHLCREGRRPVEVPIETVYIDGNKSSHFDPIRDSMRIYFVLLRFYFSSLVAAGIDFAGFSIAFATTHDLFLSVAIGRLSSVVNFVLNKRFVFQSRSSVGGSLWRYYALAVIIAAASYGLIWASATYLHWNVFVAKIIFDVLLSLVSFSAQQTFVFRHRPDTESE